MSTYQKQYEMAVEAAHEIGWLPQVIFSQWVVETAWFTSSNYVHNNNIAGQTWYANCGWPKGSTRPRAEGGYYIKYPDPVMGYVDFINRNAKRYGKVKAFKTVAEQVKAIKDAGWAVDPNYVNTVMSVYRSCLDKGIFHAPIVKVPNTVHHYLSLVDYLKDKHMASDFHSRRALAVRYNVVKNPTDYSGTAAQNEKLLEALLKKA